MWLLLKMKAGRWYVQLAATWHWYLPSRIYVKMVSVHSFVIFLFVCVWGFVVVVVVVVIVVFSSDGMVDPTNMYVCFLSYFAYGLIL